MAQRGVARQVDEHVAVRSNDLREYLIALKYVMMSRFAVSHNATRYVPDLTAWDGSDGDQQDLTVANRLAMRHDMTTFRDPWADTTHLPIAR